MAGENRGLEIRVEPGLAHDVKNALLRVVSQYPPAPASTKSRGRAMRRMPRISRNSPAMASIGSSAITNTSRPRAATRRTTTRAP